MPYLVSLSPFQNHPQRYKILDSYFLTLQRTTKNPLSPAGKNPERNPKIRVQIPLKTMNFLGSLQCQITDSPISGCTCCHHNMYNILKGWQLPDGF